MNFKLCTKCKNEKSISEFNKDKQCKDGFKARCKDCIKEYQKQYRFTHKHKAQEYRKKYSIEHKDKLRDSQRKWREKSNEYMKKYRSDNKIHILNYSKEYYIKNKSKILESKKSPGLFRPVEVRNVTKKSYNLGFESRSCRDVFQKHTSGSMNIKTPFSPISRLKEPLL